MGSRCLQTLHKVTKTAYANLTSVIDIKDEFLFET